jgi:hypothetical protein
MKKFPVLIAAIALSSNLIHPMQIAPETKKDPADLLDGCGTLASKSYTCRLLTPEEDSELKLRNKLKKLYYVADMVGKEVFEKMSEEDALAVYNAMGYKAAENIITRGGCTQQ